MNRPKVSVFLGISLDGLIAGADNDLSWLSLVATDPPEDTGFQTLLDAVDVLVLGRNSFDVAASFEPWPYAGKRVIVLTTRPLVAQHRVEAHDGDLADLLADLGRDGHRHVYLDGGAVIRQGLMADVVDELTLSWVPIILGKGIPLFTPDLGISRWRLVRSRCFASGLTQSSYVPASRQ